MTKLPSFLFSPPRLDLPEWIDDPALDYEQFRESFHDIRIVNRWFGGTRAVTSPLWRMAKRLQRGETMKVLDIGTGSADIPLALVRQARWRRRKVQVTALDNHADVLRVAREATAGVSAIQVEPGDALDLPYPRNAFHFATCSLTFHHLGLDGCIRAMREMDRVSSHGWIVNDGERTWPNLLLLHFLAPYFTKNPLTLHDATRSILRAYTRDEYRALADAAGFPDARVERRPVGRVVIVREKA
jgi:ubiquinone/menaquinone biosynthesis C-methylase UbiE